MDNKASGAARVLAAAVLAFVISFAGCRTENNATKDLRIPRGYLDTLQIETADGLISFGPFVGYYFKPEDPADLTRLHFVCFNERNFYTNDLSENEKLFEGEARLFRLPDTDFKIPASRRINPVFFDEAPPVWLHTRPEPKDEFLHFHSGYNAAGPVLYGYWLRHIGVAEFIYDMGERVTSDSPLYHRVELGPDKGFARIIEFDRGPARQE